MMIFLSAFVSYILVTHNLFDRDVFFLLLCGIIITYLANIFRMTIIVIIGHYYGIEALKWVHINER